MSFSISEIVVGCSDQCCFHSRRSVFAEDDLGIFMLGFSLTEQVMDSFFGSSPLLPTGKMVDATVAYS